MNISKKDYALLTGIVEFHFKFCEYIRETDENLFFRAIDYARTYTKVNGVVFDYWHEDNKKFLKELYDVLLKVENRYQKYVAKFGEEKAKEEWMRRKKTNKEDFYGTKNYLSNFVRHSKELDYSTFDQDDWANFCGICRKITDEKFKKFALDVLTKYLGSDNELVKDFTI